MSGWGYSDDWNAAPVRSWRQVAREYQRRTGEHLNEKSARQLATEAMRKLRAEAEVERICEEARR